MPSEDTKSLEFNQYQKPECVIESTDGCKNNPGNSFPTKVSIVLLL